MRTTKNINKKLSLGQLLMGSFALTYYLLSALMIATALFFNRFLIDTGNYDTSLKVLHSNSLVLVLALVLLAILGAITGLILFLLKKSRGLLLFVLSAILLMVMQAVFSGFEGWQKFVVETFLIIILLVLPSKYVRKVGNTDENGNETQE